MCFEALFDGFISLLRWKGSVFQTFLNVSVNVTPVITLIMDTCSVMLSGRFERQCEDEMCSLSS